LQLAWSRVSLSVEVPFFSPMPPKTWSGDVHREGGKVKADIPRRPVHREGTRKGTVSCIHPMFRLRFPPLHSPLLSSLIFFFLTSPIPPPPPFPPTPLNPPSLLYPYLSPIFIPTPPHYSTPPPFSLLPSPHLRIPYTLFPSSLSSFLLSIFPPPSSFVPSYPLL